MNTYWLTCREGPSKKREEIAWFADIEPVFLKNLQTRSEVKTRTKKYIKPQHLAGPSLQQSRVVSGDDGKVILYKYKRRE